MGLLARDEMIDAGANGVSDHGRYLYEEFCSAIAMFVLLLLRTHVFTSAHGWEWIDALLFVDIYPLLLFLLTLSLPRTEGCANERGCFVQYLITMRGSIQKSCLALIPICRNSRM